jgi:transcriptional regulator with XRE-family HTH domain
MRQVGRDTGLSTTTVGRILEGEPLDVDTLVTICNWIGVLPSEVLDSESMLPSSLGAKIAAAVSAEPELAKVFGEAIDLFTQNKMSQDELNDIVAYTTFRLRQIKERQSVYRTMPEDTPSSQEEKA